jgi:pyridoxal 5'-phosphate synthase pdxT subunit
VNDLTIGVLALQGDVREHAAALEAVGARAVAVRRASELDEVDGLVIPGGESTTMWKLAVAFDMFDPIRKRLADGMPAYGSCAGMIMLADHVLDAAPGQQTFGGIAITVRRNAFGRQVDSFEGPISFTGIDGELHGVFIRAPWVEAVDEGADGVEVLARVSDGAAHGGVGSVGAGSDYGGAVPGRIVAVRQGNLLATSFHPELTGDHRVHGVFAELVRAAR